MQLQLEHCPLEILHRIQSTILWADLTELIGEGVAKLGHAPMYVPIDPEAPAEGVLRLGKHPP